ncbi:hypothetical protein EUX98_g7206 [Antrodiella citrinella]|uniref:Uncharacterized protein n=1 Tax=Antrodiella citrinella TaxID=2447956 RepID=A0A4S4MM31_9APHY|nr:hypothetical protein EUX98_g7206 [Antrodiella citrinella]
MTDEIDILPTSVLTKEQMEAVNGQVHAHSEIYMALQPDIDATAHERTAAILNTSRS